MQMCTFAHNFQCYILEMEMGLESMESACALTKNTEVFFSSSSASRKACSSESTASSVTVRDTDVSIPARKKTKL